MTQNRKWTIGNEERVSIAKESLNPQGLVNKDGIQLLLALLEVSPSRRVSSLEALEYIYITSSSVQIIKEKAVSIPGDNIFVPHTKAKILPHKSKIIVEGDLLSMEALEHMDNILTVFKPQISPENRPSNSTKMPKSHKRLTLLESVIPIVTLSQLLQSHKIRSTDTIKYQSHNGSIHDQSTNHTKSYSLYPYENRPKCLGQKGR
jgi:hypothetical protein